jgi:L,D-transpeptidase ErfK/SrfK
MKILKKYLFAGASPLSIWAFSALLLFSAPLAIASPSGTASGLGKISNAHYTKPYIGQMQEVTASYEDTLVHIGREYGVGFVEMRAANPSVDPWLPGSGTDIIIPTLNILPDAVHEGVVINLAEMRLYYYKTPNSQPLTFPIGIGRDGLKTPLGITSVVRKKDAPTWTPTDRMRKEDPTLPISVPPGPDNPMGSHALYLGFPTIAIHGTNKPYGIGRRVSSGCIRMFPEDITQIFDMAPVGTKVTVVDQPIKAAWIDNRLFLEVHPTQEQAAIMEHEGTVPDYQLSERDLSYIMRVAGKDVKNLDWQKIRKVVKERKGYPIPIATKTTDQVAQKD